MLLSSAASRRSQGDTGCGSGLFFGRAVGLRGGIGDVDRLVFRIGDGGALRVELQIALDVPHVGGHPHLLRIETAERGMNALDGIREHRLVHALKVDRELTLLVVRGLQVLRGLMHFRCGLRIGRQPCAVT